MAAPQGAQMREGIEEHALELGTVGLKRHSSVWLSGGFHGPSFLRRILPDLDVHRGRFYHGGM